MGILGTRCSRREGKEGHLVLSSGKMLDPHFQMRCALLFEIPHLLLASILSSVLGLASIFALTLPTAHV